MSKKIFVSSIGMMVSEELIADGDFQGGQPVVTLLETVRENVSSVPVRLVGGKTPREGRLQVSEDQITNEGWEFIMLDFSGSAW